MSALNTHGVEFVLVGGYALGVHGFVRATADIDFLYRCTPANVNKLCVALTQFGAPPQLINASALLDPDTVTFLVFHRCASTCCPPSPASKATSYFEAPWIRALRNTGCLSSVETH